MAASGDENSMASGCECFYYCVTFVDSTGSFFVRWCPIRWDPGDSQ